MRHFKVDPVLKTNTTFYSRLNLCDMFTENTRSDKNFLFFQVWSDHTTLQINELQNLVNWVKNKVILKPKTDNHGRKIYIYLTIIICKYLQIYRYLTIIICKYLQIYWYLTIIICKYLQIYSVIYYNDNWKYLKDSSILYLQEIL